MLATSMPISPHLLAMPVDDKAAETIATRFGEVTVNPASAILFPTGLLGMPDKYHFVLAEFPNKKFPQFMLLQSLDDHTLSFISLPLETKNAIVAQDDIVAACEDLDISLSDLALLLVVSVHRSPEKVTLSVNARAPIFIDTVRRAAVQYVFPSEKYQVRHVISG